MLKLSILSVLFCHQRRRIKFTVYLPSLRLHSLCSPSDASLFKPVKNVTADPFLETKGKDSCFAHFTGHPTFLMKIEWTGKESEGDRDMRGWRVWQKQGTTEKNQGFFFGFPLDRYSRIWCDIWERKHMPGQNLGWKRTKNLSWKSACVVLF